MEPTFQPEPNDKEQELLAKSEILMAEMAEATLPAEIIDKLEEKIKRFFKFNKLPYSRTYLKAFLQGTVFMLSLDSVPNSQVFRPIAPGVVKLLLMRMDKSFDEATKKLDEPLDKPK